MRTLYKADISLTRTVFLGTNGVRFIEIPLYLDMFLCMGSSINDLTKKEWHFDPLPPVTLPSHCLDPLPLRPQTFLTNYPARLVVDAKQTQPIYLFRFRA